MDIPEDTDSVLTLVFSKYFEHPSESVNEVRGGDYGSAGLRGKNISFRKFANIIGCHTGQIDPG
ncbi:MAG TPA: hypothetical protein VMR90_00605 [Candidatus Cybelea sp.]|nr:hypothetical protein [Candidatus Cybelea sp.]